MKLAHLILCHNNPLQLQRLLRKLAHEAAHFYVHVDLKTDITPFIASAKPQQVTFIKNRVKVFWGGFSMVQATLNSFEEILATGFEYSHINLLSGQDYPLKSVDSIHSFLSANPGKTFMHFLSVEQEWKEALPRIRRYHFVHWNLPFATYLAERIVNTLLPKRKLRDRMIAMGRSQWFTATPESAAYIVRYVKEHPWISRFFKLSWAPDEMIFQTILYNSPFRDKMVNNNLLYVDWSEGKPNPKVLTMADADALTKTDQLFARKFNPAIDSNILDYLDKITS